MTALTLQVIWKNPPVTLHEICKNCSKISRTILFRATSALLQNLQEAAVTICSEKFGCTSQESLPKFKEHLFLMTAFKVYHICRKHGEGSSKLAFPMYGGIWGEVLPRKRKRGVWREGLPRKRKISC